MLGTLRLLVKDDAGATLVEYGVLIGFVALICLVSVKALGKNVSALFSTAASSI